MYQKIIKESNENKIFQYLFRTQKSFVINDISVALNMSFPTVKRVVNILLEKNVLYECDKIGDGVGRKATEYRFNPDFCFSIGIKICSSSLKFILINAACNILQEDEYFQKNKKMETVTFLKESIEDFINKLDSEIIDKVIGIGIATRGIVNKNSEFIDFSSTTPVSLEKLNKLKETLNLPILMENESNLSVIAESIIGDGKKLEHFVVLTLDEAISCSNFQKNTEDLFSFKAGRLHHMNIIPDGNLCECGSRGCLGAYISDKALVGEFKKFFPEIENFQEIFEKKYLDTKFGNLILEDYIKHLSIGIKNLLFFSNPEKLIISGKICNYQNLIYNKLLENIYTPNHVFYRGKDTIIFSKFKEKSPILGAAIFPIIDSLF